MPVKKIEIIMRTKNEIFFPSKSWKQGLKVLRNIVESGNSKRA